MTELERAVAALDHRRIDAAVMRYTEQSRCLTKLGQASNFGPWAPPDGGLDELLQVLARLGHGAGR